MNDINTQFELSDTPHEQLLEAQRLMAIYKNNAARYYYELSQLGVDKRQILVSHRSRPSQSPGLSQYQAQTLIFNTRFVAYPSVIVMCQSESDVVTAYQLAVKFNLPVKVRSGGHDHEGECTGNDVVLLDLSGLKTLDVKQDSQGYVAYIGAGYRFYQLIPILADTENDSRPALTIPHGTCATVGLAGYIQGGGWGPWTRLHGMCCESLIAARVLLENGEVIVVNDEHNSDLLWALRGGGALSYGIVLEFTVRAFEIPDEIHRFELHWNTKEANTGHNSTFRVLEQWETAINDENTIELVGTNLKINAISSTSTTEKKCFKELQHPCIMYGYWDGSEEELRDFVQQYFSLGKLKITGTDSKHYYDSALMGHWARNSLYDVRRLSSAADKSKPFAPDFDSPAPHKITSKVVSHQGLSDVGKEQLIRSLTSTLICKESESLGLFSYVTLGAISGPFYANDTNEKASKRVAFPYTTSQYTIQYQTWWNEKVYEVEQGQHNPVYNYVNRALDWMEVCRDTDVCGTKGAFISFKDSSIPTREYFQQHYQCLIKTKEKYSAPYQKLPLNSPPETGYNHFRSRKTIY
ncbi:FAD-dependent oxidoreductase [Vibrio sp. 10N.261.46.E11]|uniref:FAD-binding oxidoreductase n=1 Tax=Vibrio sp. 10N.261.46.E11 TaxID=3229662 RepID=UPI003552ECC6